MKKHLNLYHLFCTVFIFFFLNSQELFSQEYRDTFTKKYNLSKDSAKVYSNKLIQSKESNIKAFGLITQGYIITKEGNYVLANTLFLRGFDQIERIKNLPSRQNELMHALYFYSNYLLIKHEIKEAQVKINEGLDLSRRLKNLEMQVKFKSLIGRSYSLLGLGKKAIENGTETIRSIQSLKSKLPETFYNIELLRNYLNVGNRTLSFFYRDSINNKTYLDSTENYLRITQKFIDINNVRLGDVQKRQLLNLYSSFYFCKKDYTKAIEYYTKTLKLSESINHKKRVYQIQFRLGQCYFYMKEYQKAKELFDNLSLTDLTQYKLLKNSVTINYYYARIYSELGNIEKALSYTNIYNKKTEEYYKNINSTKINVFTQNELNEKKRILNELSKEKKNNSNLNNYLKILLLSILLLSTVIFFYVRNQRRKFQLKIKSLAEKTEKIKRKPIVTSKIKETKAQKILLKLEQIEEQELFLSKNYSLNLVAKKINSNSSYVSKIVNIYWKKSFVQYTNELRINYILLKLKDNKMYQKFTLLAIAESVGYKSLSSFNKHFKAVTGILPKQYLQYLKTNSEK